MKINKVIFLASLRKYDSQACAEVRFHETRRWLFDFALPSLKIAIEINGGIWASMPSHSRAGHIRDMKKLNEAQKLGWVVLQYEPKNATNALEDIEVILAMREPVHFGPGRLPWEPVIDAGIAKYGPIPFSPKVKKILKSRSLNIIGIPQPNQT